MSPASLVVAALIAWGPAWPAPEPATPGDVGDAVIAPSDGAPAVPETPPKFSPAPEPPVLPVAIVAKAPLDVRAQPAAKSRTPVHKQWAFWVLAGSFVVGSLVAVYVATRPEPQAYRGNAPPFYMSFP